MCRQRLGLHFRPPPALRRWILLIKLPFRRSPNLPTPGKIHADAYGHSYYIRLLLERNIFFIIISSYRYPAVTRIANDPISPAPFVLINSRLTLLIGDTFRYYLSSHFRC